MWPILSPCATIRQEDFVDKYINGSYPSLRLLPPSEAVHTEWQQQATDIFRINVTAPASVDLA